MGLIVDNLGEFGRETDTHIFFWGGFLSQWSKAPFYDKVSNINFQNAEQYMMYNKAILFNDTDIAFKILETGNPKRCKELGRLIKNFDPIFWDNSKYDIVVNGNKLKFGNHTLMTKLLLTEDKILVEASPYDKVWGIGLHFIDDRVLDETMWQGTNLLGKALMVVRDYYKT